MNLYEIVLTVSMHINEIFKMFILVGRPKGAELTVIGLPKSKKRKDKSSKIKPFSKLHAEEKDSQILRWLTGDLAVAEAMSGKRLLNTDDLNTLYNTHDSIQDRESVDIYRVQRYFDKEAWHEVLSILQRKQEIGWSCGVCAHIIDDASEDSIGCDRCLSWFHFRCTDLKNKPKKRQWFCKPCKLKFD